MRELDKRIWHAPRLRVTHALEKKGRAGTEPNIKLPELTVVTHTVSVLEGYSNVDNKYGWPEMASRVASWRQGPWRHVIINGSHTGIVDDKFLSNFSVDTPRYRYHEHVDAAYYACVLEEERGKGSSSLEMSIRDERHKDQHRSPGISFHASVNNMSDAVIPACSTYRQFEMMYCGFS
jgi:hypothetical protein